MLRMRQGHEDLRMDARIVQFMGLVNTLLTQQRSGHQPAGSHAGQAVRTFAVEALGPRFGLVEWVEGTGPLYNVYKQHAQHVAVVQAMLGAESDTQHACVYVSNPVPCLGLSSSGDVLTACACSLLQVQAPASTCKQVAVASCCWDIW